MPGGVLEVRGGAGPWESRQRCIRQQRPLRARYSAAWSLLALPRRVWTDTDSVGIFGAVWFADLDATAAAKVTVAIARIEQGTLSAFKGVGGGVLEYRVDFGPGYRVYFGLDGDTLVILLGGGTKKRQQRDIEIAKSRWTDYKQRKRHPR